MKHKDFPFKHPFTYLIVVLVCNSVQLSGQTENSNNLPQFLCSKFTKSIVKMKSGESNSAVLNYNIVDEEMIFNQKGTYMALIETEKIDTIIIQNRKFVPVEKSFYELLVAGPVSMFVQNKGRLAPVGSTTAYGMTSQTLGPTAVRTVQTGNQVRNLEIPDNVTVSPASVNWILINKEWKKFTSEKQVIKLFPEKEKELKQFLKQTNLDLKNHEDIVRLGKYLNEIL